MEHASNTVTYTVFSRKMAARSGQVPDRNKTTYTFEMNITVTDYNILVGLPAKTLADIITDTLTVRPPHNGHFQRSDFSPHKTYTRVCLMWHQETWID